MFRTLRKTHDVIGLSGIPRMFRTHDVWDNEENTGCNRTIRNS